MLEVRSIRKSFGGVEAIRGSDFRIREHEVTALIGPNGAGKTTLFDIISGLLTPDSGSVLFDGRDITTKTAFERARLGLSRTFQQVRLFHNLSIFQHIALLKAWDTRQDWRYYFSPPRAKEYAACAKLLESIGIAKEPSALVSELSYGQRKLLQLSLALERPHRLLMLDEPVAGVNKVIEAQIEQKIVALKKNRAETVLLIDHDMEFVRTVADRVIVLDAGAVIADGEPGSVLRDPKVLEAYLGK